MRIIRCLLIVILGVYIIVTGKYHDKVSKKKKVIIALLSVLLAGQMSYRIYTDNTLCTLYVTEGPSMMPTFDDHMNLVFFVKYDKLERGDIVTIKVDFKDNQLCKRIIGLPGETVEIYGDKIFIDGKLLDESGYETKSLGNHTLDQTIVLADDEYFIMGDNRSNSLDSRYFGPVKADQITYRFVTKLIG